MRGLLAKTRTPLATQTAFPVGPGQGQGALGPRRMLPAQKAKGIFSSINKICLYTPLNLEKSKGKVILQLTFLH